MNKLTAAASSVIWLLPLIASPTAAEDAAAPPTELYVRTVPPGATIVVDGKKVGISDSLFKIEPGVKRIVVELEGYEPGGQEVTIRASRITRVVLKLAERPSTAQGKGSNASDVVNWLRESGDVQYVLIADAKAVKAAMKVAQAEYDRLVVAFEKKDWPKVNMHANVLSDLVRDDLVLAFQVDQYRRQAERDGREIPLREERVLRTAELVRLELQRLLSNEQELARTRDLLQAVEDLADDLHDCIRDGKTTQAPARYELLRKAWSELCQYLVPKIFPAGKDPAEGPPCDLWIGPDDIRTFVHSNGGRYLSVSIHSKGEGHIKDVDARFYLGDPEKGGQLIGRGGLSLDAGQTATEAIPWTTSDGRHEVFVRIDPDNSIREQNERNNAASHSLTIQTLQPARPPATK